jgi:hypothetical protein
MALQNNFIMSLRLVPIAAVSLVMLVSGCAGMSSVKTKQVDLRPDDKVTQCRFITIETRSLGRGNPVTGSFWANKLLVGLRVGLEKRGIKMEEAEDLTGMASEVDTVVYIHTTQTSGPYGSGNSATFVLEVWRHPEKRRAVTYQVMADVSLPGLTWNAVAEKFLATALDERNVLRAAK